jgi:hypothetical protein
MFFNATVSYSLRHAFPFLSAGIIIFLARLATLLFGRRELIPALSRTAFRKSPKFGLQMDSRKKAVLGISAITLLLFAYILARAILVSFTHDESLTWLDFVRTSGSYPTANNHLLNTWLMKVTAGLFGNSEWSLRLPNVLAYLVYAWFTGKIALALGGVRWAAWIFIILNVNPFLLDFFSLARGYGLSISCLAMSAWYLVCFAKKPERSITVLYAMLAACLGVLANLALLNYLAALAAVLLLISFRHFLSHSPDRKKSTALSVMFMLVPLGALFAYVIPWAFELRDAGALYYGGQTGFWHDSVGSLVKNFFYYTQKPLLLTLLKTSVAVIAIAAAVVLAWDLARKQIRFSSPLMLFAMLLVFAVLSTITQHWLMGTRFLIERTALLFVPLFLLLLCALLTHTPLQRLRPFLALPVLSLLLIVHFSLALNFYSVEQWRENADIKPALYVLDKQRSALSTPQDLIYLGGEFFHEPCINYYRSAYNLNWLNKADRDGYNYMQDYFLVYDTLKYTFPRAEPVKRFPCGTVLFKNREMADNRIVLSNMHNDFENAHPKKKGLNNGYSMVCRDGAMEGLSYTLPDSVQELDLLVKCYVWARAEGDDPAAELVLQFDHNDTLRFWASVKINDYLQDERGWSRMSLLRHIPAKGYKGDVIKAYVWNTGEAEILIDDLYLTITGHRH